MIGRAGVVDLLAVLTGADAEAAGAFAVQLGSARSVAVAFSGGVDSSLTTALATRFLGRDSVVAVLGVSPSLAEPERRQAQETAAAIGVPLVEVVTQELEDARYVANRGDRCYFCKRELYTRAFADAVRATGSELLLNGDTADDRVAGDRPGWRAAVELGVRSPLAAAGIGKQQVRSLARVLGLPVWDKPAAPCLASRIAVNIPVTVDVLARVERAETALRRLGLRELRVRHLGRQARVELGPDDLTRVRTQSLDQRVLDAVRDAGYPAVVLADTPLRRA
ncbi:ATP-dependent sacrificial sulfur transferase LarE [Dactylosporangium salmoneum]|uniref:ATP-dependent sacrificial sulfur transferase LarE n=1 Tax=Dactylosporangium salmoneum TaxID=53361 RepID=A0ABP5SY46_9ACTN